MCFCLNQLNYVRVNTSFPPPSPISFSCFSHFDLQMYSVLALKIFDSYILHPDDQSNFIAFPKKEKFLLKWLLFLSIHPHELFSFHVWHFCWWNFACVVGFLMSCVMNFYGINSQESYGTEEFNLSLEMYKNLGTILKDGVVFLIILFT